MVIKIYQTFRLHFNFAMIILEPSNIHSVPQNFSYVVNIKYIMDIVQMHVVSWKLGMLGFKSFTLEVWGLV